MAKIFPPPQKKTAFHSWKSGFIAAVWVFWMSRISLSIHYHPVFVSSRRTEQNRGSASGESRKKKDEWQVCLFDFQITSASILLTQRVNKYRIQFPWSQAISWQSSKRSNRLLRGTWATVKESLGCMKGVDTLSKPQEETNVTSSETITGWATGFLSQQVS